jgi:lactobin A/cerein 7B family class IIb bacteriocin
MALRKESGIEGKDELSEEELKEVAGGVITATIAVILGSVAVAGGVGTATALTMPGW